MTLMFLGLFTLYSAYSAVYSNRAFSSHGQIRTTYNLGVYSDSACTKAVSAIDWGTLTVGTSTTYILYVKNLGTARQTLTMTTSGWTPTAAGSFITVTWNQNNVVLNASQVVKATLNLTVSTQISQGIMTFSNNITITGRA
jgi:hypothetical protein